MAAKVQIRSARAVLIDDARMFAQATSVAALIQGWGRVRDNGGAGGGDGVSIARFQPLAAMRIDRLAEQLADASYHPGPVRHVDIPKRNGRGLRRLTIPCVIDRVAQTAVATALGPLLEAEFEDASFAYRPGRSVDQAVMRLQLLHAQGFDHVVDADIEGYFDAVPHDGLMDRLAESMTDGPLTNLIALWITAAAPMGRGIAQGSPLSPLLANLYLDRLDEAFTGRDARIVRFADDFVILTRGAADAEAAMTRVAAVLADQGLRLNAEKSRVTDFTRSFRFLGHLFVRSMVMKATPEASDDPDLDALLTQVARTDAAEAERAAGVLAEVEDQAAKGFAPGLRTLFVLEAGRRLTVRNQAFGVQERLPGAGGDDWRELIAIPHQRIDRIDLGPEVDVDPMALDHAAATGTPLAWLDGHGGTRAVFAPVLAPRAGRHLAQAAVALDPTRRLELARLLVEGRLRSQRNLLRKLTRDHDPSPASVTHALVTLSRSIGRGGRGRVAQAATVDVAMGHEGAGAAAYWPAISALAHGDFRFAARRRGRDASPADIALNFLAWMLQRDIAGVVIRAGLHPGFGALHAVSDRHDACVYDLMEEFRSPLVEGLLVYVTNRRILRLDMFERLDATGMEATARAGSGWRLGRGGAPALVRAYHARCGSLIAGRGGQRRVTYRRRMLEQAHALAAHVEGRQTYVPFELPF